MPNGKLRERKSVGILWEWLDKNPAFTAGDDSGVNAGDTSPRSP